MFLKKLRIQNYKSLRDVTFEPTPFSVIIGPNGAGKTNFADALLFLSAVYQEGLKPAIQKKKGALNLVFTRLSPTEQPVRFEINFLATGDEFKNLRISKDVPEILNESSLWVRHAFGFQFDSLLESIDFTISEDDFSIARSKLENTPEILSILRGKAIFPDGGFLAAKLQSFAHNVEEPFAPTPAQLLFFQYYFSGYFGEFITPYASNFRVYHPNPLVLRGTGVFSSDAEMSLEGENFPAVIKLLQEKHADAWHIVMETMNFLWPQLEEIELAPLPDRTWGLYFKESGVGRSWRADEVSDGTVRTLAMLVAAADPRSTLVVIEEPENSIHPWVLHALVDAFRKLSARKNIILTTHSPVLIDRLYPEEVFVMSRRDGESKLENLSVIDPELKQHWLDGNVTLSSYIEGGFIEQAVPGRL